MRFTTCLKHDTSQTLISAMKEQQEQEETNVETRQIWIQNHDDTKHI